MTEVVELPRSHRHAHQSGVHDFDFLHGRWKVRNRRLRAPLAECDDWYEFEATSVVRPIWGGQGNIEEWDGHLADGPVRCLSVHLYDPLARQWRLHWTTNRDGRVGSPTVGVFRSGRGEFFDHDEHDGRAILLRIRWEDRGPRDVRWEQAFSIDGGATWETNWVMDFTRVGSAA